MTEINIPMTKAEKLILEKISALELQVRRIAFDNEAASIEEISLYKASKLLRRHPDTIIKYVTEEGLSANIYLDKNGVLRYRFRITDIKNFQRKKFQQINTETITESSEDLAKRIFHGKH